MSDRIVLIINGLEYHKSEHCSYGDNDVVLEYNKKEMIFKPYETEPKVPLFTTEDGVEVFEKDDIRYFVAISKENFAFYSSYYLGLEKKLDVLVFADFKKAEEYILNNKPIETTYNELVSLFTEEKLYPFGVFTMKLKEFFKSKINL